MNCLNITFFDYHCIKCIFDAVVCVCVCVWLYMYMHVCECISAYMCVCVCVCVCVCMYVRVCVEMGCGRLRLGPVYRAFSIFTDIFALAEVVHILTPMTLCFEELRKLGC